MLRQKGAGIPRMVRRALSGFLLLMDSAASSEICNNMMSRHKQANGHFMKDITMRDIILVA